MNRGGRELHRTLDVDALRFLGREFSQTPGTPAKRFGPGQLVSFLEHQKFNVKSFMTFRTRDPGNFHNSNITLSDDLPGTKTAWYSRKDA